MGIVHRLDRAFLAGAALVALSVSSAVAQDSGTESPNVPNILDTITVTATRSAERAIESLAGVSVVDSETSELIQPERLSDLFQGMPGVWFNQNRDDIATGFNVRGLQDYGRVAVIVDGARQNFQQSSHGPQGQVFIDPALISSADVVRGPVANIYGSGAIGGVVSMTSTQVDDILRGSETFAMELLGGVNSNGPSPEVGGFVAARPSDRFEFVGGVHAYNLGDYRDGDGNVVANTGSRNVSGVGKVIFYPGEGHRLELGTLGLHSEFDSGQPGSPFNPFDGPVYGNVVNNLTSTAAYTYVSPDNQLIDFSATGYWVRTTQEMVVKESYGACDPVPTFCFTGPVGTQSSFEINTLGFDIHNTSRFAALGLDHTVTYGGDLFSDRVVSDGDYYGPDSAFTLTPDGNRAVGGGFVQWLAEYGTWLDVILAGRYDAYRLEGGGFENSGSRFSPKATVGITPIEGVTLYATYAEGYRAPAVSEALVSGFHPGSIFAFIPNPDLRPEIGRNLEGGVNLAFNNVLTGGDTLRIKGNLFRNNVEDYIDLDDVTGTPGCTYFSCYGYVNIANARLQGAELEGVYDAGAWFGSLSYTHVVGTDVATGDRLASVAPDNIQAVLGARFFDRRLTLGGRYQYVWGEDENPSTGTPAEAYSLVGLFASYQPNEYVTASLVVDNLLNTQYTRYLENLPSPGLSVKGSLKVRWGH